LEDATIAKKKKKKKKKRQKRTDRLSDLLVAPALALIVAGTMLLTLGLVARIWGPRRPPNDPNRQR
jgi:hypothetical protein